MTFLNNKSSMNFEDELKALDQEWGNYVPEKKLGVDDGQHIAIIDVARIQPNTFTDELELYLELIVTEGKFKGRKMFVHRPLKDPKKWFLIKNDLKVLEIQLPSISMIGDFLVQMINVIVKVKAETKSYENKHGEKKSFQNYEFISKVNGHNELNGEQDANGFVF